MKFLVPTLLLATVSCSSQQTPEPSSNVSSFSIGALNTGSEETAWTNMSLSIKKADSDTLLKSLTFQKSQFGSSTDTKTASDLSVKIPFGRYTFALKYLNAEGQVVYESCKADAVYDIQVAVYKKSIDICARGSSTPVATAPIDPTSDVILNPQVKPGTPVNAGAQPSVGKKEIVAYYQSWSSGWASDGKNMNLAKLPPYITTVLLSFVRPEASYQAGQNTWSGTGMDFSSDFGVVKDAIKVLKATNPGTKVLLSVGGATYVNWSQANAQSIAALVNDLGADGADLDYEPSAGTCAWGTGGNSCPADQEFINIIKKFRAALPKPLLITTAAWSTGAFGTEQYPASSMAGNLIGANFGLYINPLKQVGDLFDAIFIMSYDAGSKSAPTATGYDPKMAFDAYRALFKGPLMLGVEVPPEAWGGHISTPKEAQERAQYVLDHGGQGMMIWSIQKVGTPTASEFVQAMCQTLSLTGCSLALSN